MRYLFLRILFWGLFIIFCLIYPFSVVGLVTGVKPPLPISLGWAASFLLYLEGALILCATALLYGVARTSISAAFVLVFTYLVETLGVNTGFPFGHYYYSDTLVPGLPGSVPLAVLFAWVMVVFGSKHLVKRRLFGGRKGSVGVALAGGLLAVLLDLVIEPVAAHIVNYWKWLASGLYNYYGVPIANFVAWFVVAFMSVFVVIRVLQLNNKWHEQSLWEEARKMGVTGRLAMFVPGIVFCCSLLMFGLVDFVHEYYWSSVLALCVGLIILAMWGPHVFFLHDQHHGAA